MWFWLYLILVLALVIGWINSTNYLKRLIFLLLMLQSYLIAQTQTKLIIPESCYSSITKLNDTLLAFVSKERVHFYHASSTSVITSFNHEIIPIDSSSVGVLALHKNLIFHSTLLDGFTIYEWNIFQSKPIKKISTRFRDTLVMNQYYKNNKLYLATEFGIEFSKDLGKTWKLVTIDKTQDDDKRMNVNLSEVARNKTSICRITEVDNHLFCVTSSGKIYTADFDLKNIRFYFDLKWGGFTGNVAQVDADHLLMQGSFSPIYLVHKKEPNKIDTLALTKEFTRDARFSNIGNDIVLFPNNEKRCYIYNRATKQFDVYLDNETWGKIYNIIQEKDSRFIFTTTGVYLLN